MKDTLASLIPLVAPVLATFLVALLGVLTAKLNSYIVAHVKNKKWAGILTRLDDTVATVVSDIMQTMALKLKAMPDSAGIGKLTENDAAELKNIAVGKLKSYMGPAGLVELTKILDLDDATIEKYLGSKIEAAVLVAKNAAPPTPSNGVSK